MTVTVKYLERHAAHVVVYVRGDEKKETLEAVLGAKDPVHVMPARLLHNLPSVDMVTDIALKSPAGDREST